MLSSSGLYKTYQEYKAEHPRLNTQLMMAIFTLFVCQIAAIFAAPGQSILETLSVGTGYAGLLLIMATLVMGPLKMLKTRKNPVNINSRRDVGIWAGIASLAHVVFSTALQLSWGGSLWSFFFYENGSPKFNLFGISNDFGLVGALVILFLLVLSNNFFLKRLKGKNWKNMQRFNYLLFAVALVHTITQQANVSRNPLLIFGVIALAGLVVVAQSVGFVTYRRRAEQRKVSPTPAAKPALSPSQKPRASVSVTQPTKAGYSRAYSNSRQSDSLIPKSILYVLAGLLSIFVGFEVVDQGPHIVSALSTALSNNSASDTNSDTSSSTSSSSSQVQVSSPSFSQPSIRTGHS